MRVDKAVRLGLRVLGKIRAGLAWHKANAVKIAGRGSTRTAPMNIKEEKCYLPERP